MKGCAYLEATGWQVVTDRIFDHLQAIKSTHLNTCKYLPSVTGVHVCQHIIICSIISGNALAKKSGVSKLEVGRLNS